jgi:hypothetical protein
MERVKDDGRRYRFAHHKLVLSMPMFSLKEGYGFAVGQSTKTGIILTIALISVIQFLKLPLRLIPVSTKY